MYLSTLTVAFLAAGASASVYEQESQGQLQAAPQGLGQPLGTSFHGESESHGLAQHSAPAQPQNQDEQNPMFAAMPLPGHSQAELHAYESQPHHAQHVEHIEAKQQQPDAYEAAPAYEEDSQLDAVPHHPQYLQGHEPQSHRAEFSHQPEQEPHYAQYPEHFEAEPHHAQFSHHAEFEPHHAQYEEHFEARPHRAQYASVYEAEPYYTHYYEHYEHKPQDAQFSHYYDSEPHHPEYAHVSEIEPHRARFSHAQMHSRARSPSRFSHARSHARSHSHVYQMSRPAHHEDVVPVMLLGCTWPRAANVCPQHIDSSAYVIDHVNGGPAACYVQDPEDGQVHIAGVACHAEAVVGSLEVHGIGHGYNMENGNVAAFFASY